MIRYLLCFPAKMFVWETTSRARLARWGACRQADRALGAVLRKHKVLSSPPGDTLIRMDGSADTTRAPLGAEEAALLEIAAAEETAIRLRIHDASRIEWIVAVPLPRERPLPYQIDVEVEGPASAAGRDAPWGPLQTLTPPDGPTQIASSADLTI